MWKIVVIVIGAVAGYAIGQSIAPESAIAAKQAGPNYVQWAVAAIVGLPSLYVILNAKRYPSQVVNFAILALSTIIFVFIGKMPGK